MRNLFESIEYNNVQATQDFLSKMDNINMLNIHRQTPLIASARFGRTDIIKMIMNHQPPPDFTLQDTYGYAVFDYFKVKPAIDSQVQIDILRQCLFQLAKNGDISTLRRMKKIQEFNFNIADDNGNTALHCAAQMGHTGLIDLFPENYEIRNEKKETPIETAAYYGQYDISLSLLKKGVKSNRVLLSACRGGKVNFIESILKSSYDQMLITDCEGGIANLLYEAVISDQDDLIQILLKYDPNCRHSLHAGSTPIHHAVAKLKQKSLKKLLELNFPINVPDKEQKTPKELARFLTIKMGVTPEDKKEYYQIAVKLASLEFDAKYENKLTGMSFNPASPLPFNTNERFELERLRHQIQLYELETRRLLLTEFLKNIRQEMEATFSKVEESEKQKIVNPIVFFSYAWEEVNTPAFYFLQNFLLRLSKDLETAGLKVWFDIQSLNGDLENQMRENIQKSHFILFFGTRRYSDRTGPDKNTNALKELKFALSEAKKSNDFMLPLMLEGDFKKTFPDQLKSYLIRDWRNCYEEKNKLNFWQLEENYVQNLTQYQPLGILPCLLGLNRNDEYRRLRESCFLKYKSFKDTLDSNLQCRTINYEKEASITSPVSPRTRYSLFPDLSWRSFGLTITPPAQHAQKTGSTQLLVRNRANSR